MIDLWVEHVDGVRPEPREWANECIATLPHHHRADAASSLSHHRDWLAVGVSSGGQLGVDVLTVPPDADFVDDTALVLSAAEIDWVRTHPPHQCGAAFAECWTRKEAYAKWRGTGLTADLRDLTLTPVSNDTSVVFWTARVEDALVAIATRGPDAPRVRMHRP